MAGNSITIWGNVGRDPEQRRAGDTPILAFSVGTRGRKRDATNWFNVSVFGRQAERLAQHNLIFKGQWVVVTGTLESREHEGKTYWDLNATDVALGPKQAARQESQSSGWGAQQSEPQPSGWGQGGQQQGWGKPQGGGDPIPF